LCWKAIIHIIAQNLIAQVDGRRDRALDRDGREFTEDGEIFWRGVGRSGCFLGVAVDVAEVEDLCSLDSADALDLLFVGTAAHGDGFNAGLDAHEFAEESAGGGAVAVVEHDDVLGGERLRDVGEAAVAGDLDAHTVGFVGGCERIVKVPAHQAGVVVGLVWVRGELVLKAQKWLIGQVVIISVVEPIFILGYNVFGGRVRVI
jgi:hypothetical protein